MTAGRLPLTYVLPIRVATAEGPETAAYLDALVRIVDVIVVDGSDAAVFSAHATAWPAEVVHVRPDEGLPDLAGKAKGVHTGLALTRTEHVVIADDDVRWTEAQLRRVDELLHHWDFVRPQNIFEPRPWHASWDTGRVLVNRVFGGDHGGTVALRRSRFEAAGGYDGRALFENLELERTIEAAGGSAHVALDLLVVRRPPPTAHFLGQRVRQAYDEFARPRRLVVQLALLPAGLVLARVRSPVRSILGMAAVAAALGEGGRRRGGGTAVFPPTAALWTPLWVGERAFTSWLAVASRVLLGGVRWGDRRMSLAANRRTTIAARISPRRRVGTRP